MKRKPILADWIYEFNLPPHIVEETLNKVKQFDFSAAQLGRQIVLDEDPEFDYLPPIFDACLEEVRKDLELRCSELKSTLFWVNRSVKGEWHSVHKHSNSWASGILYLNDSGSCTWFSKDSLWADTGAITIYGQADVERVEIYQYPTTPGRLLIFPSKMMHSVNEHDLVAPRYTISFNSWPRGVVGSNEALNKLHLG
jgi:hypothetical protein